MMTVVIVASIILLLAIPVIVDNRDLLRGRVRARRHRHEEEALPFLFIPTTPVETPITPLRPGNDATWRPMTPRGASVADDGVEQPWRTELRGLGGTGATVDGIPRDGNPLERIPLDDQPLTNASTMVFRRPVDEPIQLLPGRFEVLAGEQGRDDIRLVGRMGEPAQIVIGREPGPPPRAITLHSPTVSRRHARLDFVDGRWLITNMSKTNPVLVNDEMVAPDGAASTVLSDGDRVELGEVVLRFHAH